MSADEVTTEPTDPAQDHRTPLERLAIPRGIYQEWSGRQSVLRKWGGAHVAALLTVILIIEVIYWSWKTPVQWPIRLLLIVIGVLVVLLVGSGVSKGLVWADTAAWRRLSK